MRRLSVRDLAKLTPADLSAELFSRITHQRELLELQEQQHKSNEALAVARESNTQGRTSLSRTSVTARLSCRAPIGW